MKILMTGVTGLIGKALSQRLQGEGHQVAGFSRSPERARDLAVDELYKWEPVAGPPPTPAFDGVDAVVHLAGEPIAEGRWSDERKKAIRDSRVLSTRHLVEGMRSAPAKPSVFVSGSAVGIYGDRGDEMLEEDATPSSDFLGKICQEWEAEAAAADPLGIRTVVMRTGVVLSKDGGALSKMLPAFRMGVAGPLGNGRQWFPWIHIDDIVGLFHFALTNPSLVTFPGALPMNGTAPGVVTNAEFTKELGAVLHRPAFIPVPEFGLKLLFGEMAVVLTASQRAVPKAAQEAGYKFQYPELTPALENLLGSREGSSR